MKPSKHFILIFYVFLFIFKLNIACYASSNNTYSPEGLFSMDNYNQTFASGNNNSIGTVANNTLFLTSSYTYRGSLSVVPLGGGTVVNGNALDNMIYINGRLGNFISIYGGRVTSSGNANGNFIYMAGGSISGDITMYGGYTASGNADSNLIVINGGTIGSGAITINLYAGASDNGSANYNLIVLEGGTYNSSSTLNLYGSNQINGIGNILSISTQINSITNISNFNSIILKCNDINLLTNGNTYLSDTTINSMNSSTGLSIIISDNDKKIDEGAEISVYKATNGTFSYAQVQQRFLYADLTQMGNTGTFTIGEINVIPQSSHFYDSRLASAVMLNKAGHIPIDEIINPHIISFYYLQSKNELAYSTDNDSSVNVEGKQTAKVIGANLNSDLGKNSINTSLYYEFGSGSNFIESTLNNSTSSTNTSFKYKGIGLVSGYLKDNMTFSALARIGKLTEEMDTDFRSVYYFSELDNIYLGLGTNANYTYEFNNSNTTCFYGHYMYLMLGSDTIQDSLEFNASHTHQFQVGTNLHLKSFSITPFWGIAMYPYAELKAEYDIASQKGIIEDVYIMDNVKLNGITGAGKAGLAMSSRNEILLVNLNYEKYMGLKEGSTFTADFMLAF